MQIDEEDLTTPATAATLEPMTSRRAVENQIFRRIEYDCEQVAVVVVRSGEVKHYYSVASEISTRKSLRAFEIEHVGMTKEDRLYVSRGLRKACRRFKLSKPNFLDC